MASEAGVSLVMARIRFMYCTRSMVMMPSLLAAAPRKEDARMRSRFCNTFGAAQVAWNAPPTKQVVARVSQSAAPGSRWRTPPPNFS